MTEADKGEKYVPKVKKKNILMSEALAEHNNVLIYFSSLPKSAVCSCPVMSSAEVKAKFHHLTD